MEEELWHLRLWHLGEDSHMGGGDLTQEGLRGKGQLWQVGTSGEVRVWHRMAS